MKLHEAKLCVECEEIVPDSAEACPSCTCRQFLILRTALKTLLTRAHLDGIRSRRSTKSPLEKFA